MKRFDHHRLDGAEIRLGATPILITPEGFRHYRGIATIGDVVLVYNDEDPPHNEFRPGSEVASERAAATLLGKPLTNEHPRLMRGKLFTADDTGGIQDSILGVVLESHVTTTPLGKPAIEVVVVVYSRELQGEIESGKVELSPGYDSTPDPIAIDSMPPRVIGEHEGMPYHVVQREVKYNHLSVVSRARTRTQAGEFARLDQGAYMDPENMITDACKTDAGGLSEAGLAAVAAMEEADRKFIESCIAKAMEDEEEDKEEASEELVEAGAELAAVEISPEQAVGEVDAKNGSEGMDEIKKQLADLAAKIETIVKGNGGARADSAGINIDEVLKKAEERSRKALNGAMAEQLGDIERLKSAGVRVDSYDRESVMGGMLAHVITHTPSMKPLAERAVKDGRFGDLRELFTIADTAARSARIDAEGQTLGRAVFDANPSGVSYALPGK